MPLFSIYSLALEQDQEQSVGLQQANTTLHNQTFIQVSAASASPTFLLLIQRHFTSQLTCRLPHTASAAAQTGAREEAEGHQGALDSSQEKTGWLFWHWLN